MDKERILHLLDLTLECRKLKKAIVSFSIDQSEYIHIYTSKPVKGITSTFYYNTSLSNFNNYIKDGVMSLNDKDLKLAEKHIMLLLNDPKYGG